MTDFIFRKKKNKDLQFEKIEISFIYGYVNYNLHKSAGLLFKDDNGRIGTMRKLADAPKVIPYNGFKEMWAPIYNLNRSTDGFCRQDLKIDGEDEKTIKITPKNNPKSTGITAQLSAHILRKRYEKYETNPDGSYKTNPDGTKQLKELKKTDGGPGCLTIKISISEKDNPNLNTNTIFDILNLAPRTSISPNLFEIKELKEYFEKYEISKDVSKFSDIFKLFCNLLYDNQKCWSELYMPPKDNECHKDCLKTDEENKCNRQCNGFYPFYDEHSEIDPQIPYMLVEGFLPKNFYKKVFINGNNSQKDYTNEIGCLLGRWLNTENKGHLNTDYYGYYKDIDAAFVKENDKNVFISRFRDKKTFVILSSLMTLVLKCTHFDENIEEKGRIAAEAADNAVKLTTNAVLSYLEFSRTRLHNALWLNKQLDKLVNEVDEKETTSAILYYKNKLNTLKVKVAKSMNNPISYMWDSVLGQEIPSLKINRNVEKLEDDTIQKLNLINELIADKIQNAQILDYIDAIESK